jgi:hypothetical protein
MHSRRALFSPSRKATSTYVFLLPAEAFGVVCCCGSQNSEKGAAHRVRTPEAAFRKLGISVLSKGHRQTVALQELNFSQFRRSYRRGTCPGGRGLIGIRRMRERFRQFGGSLEINSNGTLIKARLSSAKCSVATA